MFSELWELAFENYKKQKLRNEYIKKNRIKFRYQNKKIRENFNRKHKHSNCQPNTEKRRHFDEDAPAHDHNANEHADEHDASAEHDGHDHGPGSIDPHIWLSPENAVVIARWMKDDLAPLYPQQQSLLEANLATFEQRMQALEQQLTERFAPLKDKPYFVFHDGYGYLESYLGLQHSGVFSLAHEIQPGARHVNELRNTLSAAAPACVFSEPQFTPRLINSLTAGLPVQSAQLDPMGAATEVGPHGYEQQLRALTNTWASCLEQL